jgi:hypothetical protein
MTPHSIPQIIEIKPLNRMEVLRGFKNAGGKIEGKYAEVVENTYRKNVHFPA